MMSAVQAVVIFVVIFFAASLAIAAEGPVDALAIMQKVAANT